MSGAAVWPLMDTEPIAAARTSVTDHMRTMSGLRSSDSGPTGI